MYCLCPRSTKSSSLLADSISTVLGGPFQISLQGRGCGSSCWRLVWFYFVTSDCCSKALRC
jgi:hypothetical protein